MTEKLAFFAQKEEKCENQYIIVSIMVFPSKFNAASSKMTLRHLENSSLALYFAKK